MSGMNRKVNPKLGRWFVMAVGMLIVLPSLYVLSQGPAANLQVRTYMKKHPHRHAIGRAYGIAYHPLNEVFRHGPPWLRDMHREYIYWWKPHELDE
jgi:hypothetical protein